MKRQRHYKYYRAGLLCTVSLTIGLAGLGMTAGAVDPGWNTGDDISQTTSGYDDGTISAPVINEGGNTNNNNQNSSSVSAPIIGGGGAGSIGNSNNYRSSANNTSSNDNNSNDQSDHQSNDDDQNHQNASSSSLSSSESNSESRKDNVHKVHEHHESKASLREFARESYESTKAALRDQNKQRVLTNDAKGAEQLRSAYKSRLKQIRSGKIDKETRDKYVNQQKSSLQQALSQRLAALQTDYDNGQKQVRREAEALPADHAHDKAAMQLDNALANLDYQLGQKSNRVYTRYNRSVNELLAQTAKVKHSERSKQRKQAKAEYQANLDAVDALDPIELKHANKQRLNHLKSLYQEIQDQIDNGKITRKDQISNKLDL